MKVALVHDYLNEFGGAERVLEAFCKIWPDAPIYTAFYRKGSPAYKRFKDKKIITSWVQNVPFFSSKLHSPFRFLAPLIWGSFDFKGFEVVIGSSSWYVTKGFKKENPSTRSNSAHKRFLEICYCHTPPRYLYGYPTATSHKSHLVKIYAAIVNHYMRVYDFESAQKVDLFIANSKEVASRIKKFYRRDSTVIYPPVDVDKFKVQSSKLKTGNYFLVVSRLVGAKNVDVAISVCINLGLSLKIVGTGRDMESLMRMARGNPKIEFMGDVDDQKLKELYQNSRALIFPASHEDFGIVPIESMDAGKPVIALAQGGVLETVVDGKTGIFVGELSVEAFEASVKKFLELEKKGQWDSNLIKKHAQKYSKKRFTEEIKKFVSEHVKQSHLLQK